jgi:hypothetical protein
MSASTITYKKEHPYEMNSEKHIGLDAHQATIVVEERITV